MSQKKSPNLVTQANKLIEICKNTEYSKEDANTAWDNLRHEINSYNSKDAIQLLSKLYKSLSMIRNSKTDKIQREIGLLILKDWYSTIKREDDKIPEIIAKESIQEFRKKLKAVIKLSLELWKHGNHIIPNKEEQSKRFMHKLIRANQLLPKLKLFKDFYQLAEIFEFGIDTKNIDLQLFALYNLEAYYAMEKCEISNVNEALKLERLITSTNSKEIAFTCCQILLHSKLIDESEARKRKDRWVSRNKNQLE